MGQPSKGSPNASQQRAAVDAVASIARVTAFPLLLLVVLGGFLAVQRWIDRDDPKLAASPGWPDSDLRFG